MTDLKQKSIHIWRKVAKLSALFLLPVVIVLGCKKEKTDLGDSLQSSSLNVIKTDTFKVLTYTEIEDSVPTQTTSTSPLGAYNDPFLGNVECGIATQFVLSSANPDLGSSSTTIVDSLMLSLRFAGINFYANFDDVTIEVLELDQDLTVENNQKYYAFEEPQTTGSNLVLSGFETLKPDIFSKVIVGDKEEEAQLRIPLDPSLGQKLISLNEAGNLSSTENFVANFKGLYIKANMPGLSPGQGTVLYFDLRSVFSQMVLYFHTSTNPAIQSYPFLINSKAANYNHITFDRSGTEMEQNANADNPEKFYVQGSGARGVIELPSIMDLNYDEEGNYKPKIINQAKLILPVQDFEGDPFVPINLLFITKKRTSDGVFEIVTDYFDNGTRLPRNELYDPATKSYTFTITEEVQKILNETKENTPFFIYPANFNGSTIERLILNGTGSLLKERPRLEVTYTEY